MKPIFTKNKDESKTYILYGNTNDDFITPDLIIRDLESYLVKLLKDQGVDYVVFYGSDGTKGQFTLDPESARFFFSENSSIPLPNKIYDLSKINLRKEVNNQSNPNQRPPRRRRGGSIEEFLEAGKKGNTTNQVSQNETTNQPQSNNQPSQTIRYDFRGRDLSSFITEIHNLTTTSEKNIAVVFYNILASDLNNSNVLRSDILTNWERRGANTLCILISPQDPVDQLGGVLPYFGDKFYYVENNEMVLSEVTTFKINGPEKDELKYLLQRLNIIGTKKKNKITFNYEELDEIVDRIVFMAMKNRTTMPKLSGIIDKLENYIDTHSNLTGGIFINKAKIDEIWEQKINENEDVPLFEQLKKPGWENAFTKVKSALDFAEKRKDLKEEINTQNVEWTLNRFNTEAIPNPLRRTEIPNFILYGNPGTGKTTIAKLIGRILKEAGIIEKGHTVAVTKSDITSSYVNGSPRQTLDKINEAIEGVLFIDEAHVIAEKDGTDDSTGKQVISTLNGALTDDSKRFSLVIAGYEKEMQDLLNLDNGFASRFGINIIKIPDYKPELLEAILIEKLNDFNLKVDEELLTEKEEDGVVYTPLRAYLERIYMERDRNKFANGREMETLAKELYRVTEDSIISEEDFYKLSIPVENVTHEWFIPIKASSSFEKIKAEIENEFVGMDNIIEVFDDLRLAIEDQQNKHPDQNINIGHFMLTGNPGTGKTSVGNMLARLLYQYNIVGTPNPVIVNASDIASIYRGGPQEKIGELVREAQSKQAFLFVDEAHQLIDDSTFGNAISSFMAPMTNKENPIVVCFALYDKYKEDFLEKDSGVASRIKHQINLKDYEPEALYEIFLKMLSKRNLNISEEAKDVMKKIFVEIYKNKTEQTGNARNVENIIDEIKKLYLRRLDNKDNIELQVDEIIVEDIPKEYRDLVVEKDVEAEYEIILKQIDNDFVGMDDVKNIFRRLKLRIQREKEKNPDSNIDMKHFLLTGNPGTGKTSIGRLLARLLYQFDLVGTPEPIIVNATSLASPYSGGSQTEVMKLIEKAQKKKAFLFIDEAHQLLKDDFRDTLSSFMAPMTDKENPIVVAFALYKDYKTEFLHKDPGMTDRIGFEIDIEDYTPEELYEIFLKMLSKQGIDIENNAAEVMKRVFENIYRNRTVNTGNARKVESLVQEILDTYLIRKDESPDFVEEIITIDDIPEKYRKNIDLRNVEEELKYLENLEEEINTTIIGNNDLKAVLIEKIKELIYAKKYPEQTIGIDIEPGHYFFVGPAGTGKTTGAETLAKYFYKMGLINDENLLKYTAQNLIAGYVGQSAIATKKVLDNIRGHIGFIDEAYALDPNASGSYTNDFKSDAIAEIVAAMDDASYRNTTSIIFAGYKEPMKKFQESNEGISGRIKVVEFPAFTSEQSYEVLKSIIMSLNFVISNEIEENLRALIKELITKPNYQNGRTMRNLANILTRNAKDRLLREDKEQARFEIIQEDIPTIEMLSKSLNII